MKNEEYYNPPTELLLMMCQQGYIIIKKKIIKKKTIKNKVLEYFGIKKKTIKNKVLEYFGIKKSPFTITKIKPKTSIQILKEKFHNKVILLYWKIKSAVRQRIKRKNAIKAFYYSQTKDD